MGGSSQLLEWLDQELPTDPRRRCLVVASSSAGAAALRRALAEQRGVLLGVDFVTPRGLALEVLALGRVYWSEVRPDPLEEREALREMLPAGSIGDYARRFDSALTHLLRTIREVQALGPAGGTAGDGTGLIIELTREFTAAFQHKGTTTNLIAAATHVVANGGISFPDRVLLVGYEDPDRNLLLLLQVLEDKGVPVVRSPAPTEPPRSVNRRSCSNPLAELRFAARLCTDSGAAGTPWHEMVVTAPDLAPYLTDLRFAFDREGVPFHTSAETPLVQFRRPALCLHLCRLLFGEAPGTSFLALAASALLRKRTSPREHLELERSVRKQGLRGTGPVTRDQLDRLADRLPDRSPLVELLQSVLEAATKGEDNGGHRRRSDILAAFMTRHLLPPTPEESDVTERLDECLRAVLFANLHDATDDAYCTELQQLLESRSISIEGSTQGGVQVVPLHDALAFPCSHLHLLGLTEKATAGSPPCTTFLDDSHRDALGMRTAESASRTRTQLLRRLVCHSPRLVVSYPRTNVDGQGQVFSPLVERLGEVSLPEEEREPSHPQAIAGQAVDSGRCPADIAATHLALSGCEDPRVYRSLLGFEPTLTLERVAELESFRGEDLSLDGDIGSTAGNRLLKSSFSVTRLEQLTKCPQSFLFQKVMGVRPLDEEPEPLDMSKLEVGQQVHTVLEKLYGEFLPSLQSAQDPTDLAGEMQERTSALLREELAANQTLLAREFPGLHELATQRLLSGLNWAIDQDLEMMKADGSRPESIEEKITAELLFRHPQASDPIALQVSGKLDRVDHLSDGGARVLDYKTGTKPKKLVNATATLRGQQLQLILYGMLARASSGEYPDQLEVRSVQPRRDVEPTDHPHRHELKDARGFLDGKYSEGMTETLAILARLIRRGLFVPIAGRHCTFCAYRPACRRHHPPSRERVSQCEEPEMIELKALAEKSPKKPLLPREVTP